MYAQSLIELLWESSNLPRVHGSHVVEAAINKIGIIQLL